MNIMKDQLIELLGIPSPIGYTKEAIDYLKKAFQELGLPITELKKGAFYATIPGKTKEAMLLGAHVDTLGALVREIKNSGRIKVIPLGGMPWTGVEGETLLLHTRKGESFTGTLMPVKSSVHIHGDDVRKVERNSDTVEVRLDEDVSSKEEVEQLGISIGDFISFSPRTEFTEKGYIKSRYLDDKSCCIILLALARKMKEDHIRPRKTLHLYISNYEELGHGLYGIPQEVDELISVDIGCVGEGQSSTEKTVTIFAKDGKTPYDYDLVNQLVHVAEENKIPYVIDAIEFYGSDATAALSQGRDVRIACLGPGVESTHHYERTHQDALQASLDLLLAFVQ